MLTRFRREEEELVRHNYPSKIHPSPEILGMATQIWGTWADLKEWQVPCPLPRPLPSRLILAQDNLRHRPFLRLNPVGTTWLRYTMSPLK
jgi:hypothetical protein